MADHIKIRKAPGTWVVRVGGAVIGESSDALELSEGPYPPAIYFPRSDLAMAFLEPTDSTTRCPYKGTANYFSIVTKSETIEDAAWTYETPIDGAAEIKDHLAFYLTKVTVEQL
ncbi:DUF427 domain-containing protein [Pseudaestuariivita rosea]|uniref:DUF427 domain-containing protein n=1 Tax=Pseudaestuariivita rosea TaxID=2763263 RepID=UPI001ABB5A64|nr:DUF427 domain-containing protein [Pseudaestuariivita rosea]